MLLPTVRQRAAGNDEGQLVGFQAVLAQSLDHVDVDAFEHLAFYDADRQRIEMHLVALRDQTIALRGADLRVDIARGERILTEISRKFTRATVESMLAEGGMTLQEWLPAADGTFALAVARSAPRVLPRTWPT